MRRPLLPLLAAALAGLSLGAPGSARAQEADRARESAGTPEAADAATASVPALPRSSAREPSSREPSSREPSWREQSCLSGGDLREAVSERRVVEPLAAIRAAREAVPRAEIVRVNLCHREGEALVYVITALRKNGQFVHVTVDSRSGTVDALQ